MFPPGQLNQEAIEKRQKLVKIERKINREDLDYKSGDAIKYKLCESQKLKAMPSFGIGILNGTTILGIANNDQLNLKNTNYNF